MLQGLSATTQILGTIKHERVRWPPSARPPRPHSRPPALSLAVQRWHRADAHTCTSAQPDVAAQPILTATTLARAQAYDSGRGARRRRKAEDASSTAAPARVALRAVRAAGRCHVSGSGRRSSRARRALAAATGSDRSSGAVSAPACARPQPAAHAACNAASSRL